MAIFNIKVNGTSLKDFQSARDSLIMQGTEMLVGAPDKATYAFGQKIDSTRWEVEKAFKSALRNLDSMCSLATGTGLNGSKPEEEESLVDVIKKVS